MEVVMYSEGYLYTDAVCHVSGLPPLRRLNIHNSNIQTNKQILAEMHLFENCEINYLFWFV